MAKKTLADLGDLSGKKVLVRVDFNVPMDKKTGAVKNDRRIRAALPTVQALLDAGAAVIAMSHLGRPEKASPEDRPKLAMDRVAARFGELLGKPVKKAADTVVGAGRDRRRRGPEAGRRAVARKPPVRPAGTEERPRVRRRHRGPRRCLRQRRLRHLPQRQGREHGGRARGPEGGRQAPRGRPARGQGTRSHRRPFGQPWPAVLLAVMGGAKVSDKIAFINALLEKVDHLLVGGKMAYAFLKAIGVDVGATRVGEEEEAAARKLIPHIGSKIALPDGLRLCQVGRPGPDGGVRGADRRGLRGRRHRAEDPGRLRREDRQGGDGDLERAGRLVRAAAVLRGHPGDRRRRWPRPTRSP